MKAKDIKESLTAQLKKKGANVSHFSSLIDDYIFYWKQEREMQKDIKEHGPIIKKMSAKGFEIDSDNPACKLAVLYNKQKLAILGDLGLSTDSCSGEDDEL